MKIILIDNVKGTGKKDEVKEVKDGYGSFLIKNKKAVLYSTKSNEVLNTQIKDRNDKEEQLILECTNIKNKLEISDLTFRRYMQEIRAYLINFELPYELKYLKSEEVYYLKEL